MPLAAAASWFMAAGIYLNKTELENVQFHYGNEDGSVNVPAFLESLRPPVLPTGTSFGVEAPPNPHKSHLALSGASHFRDVLVVCSLRLVACNLQQLGNRPTSSCSPTTTRSGSPRPASCKLQVAS